MYNRELQHSRQQHHKIYCGQSQERQNIATYFEHTVMEKGACLLIVVFYFNYHCAHVWPPNCSCSFALKGLVIFP